MGALRAALYAIISTRICRTRLSNCMRILQVSICGARSLGNFLEALYFNPQCHGLTLQYGWSTSEKHKKQMSDLPLDIKDLARSMIGFRYTVDRDGRVSIVRITQQGLTIRTSVPTRPSAGVGWLHHAGAGVSLCDPDCSQSQLSTP